MTYLTSCLPGLGALASGTCSGAPDPRLEAAIPAIESTIYQSGVEVAVAFRTLDGRSQWLLHADESFHAASTMKVAVLIELYRQAREGRVCLDQS
jgi:beta-lactamase class A